MVSHASFLGSALQGPDAYLESCRKDKERENNRFVQLCPYSGYLFALSADGAIWMVNTGESRHGMCAVGATRWLEPPQ